MSLVGDRMRELRGSSSQREMAEAIGIKQNAWARYEQGGALPGVDILTRICRIHACSADWLLGLDDKLSHGEKVSARAGAGGIAIAGSGNRVTGVVAGAPTTGSFAQGYGGLAAACAKCPYKKKLKALEKVLNK